MRTPSAAEQKDSLARTVCAHGVVTAAPYRRRGIATALLKEYIHRLKACVPLGSKAEEEDTESFPSVERVALLCHNELQRLYERAGFVCTGPSTVVHGPRPWLEMCVDFNDVQTSTESTETARNDTNTINPNTSGSQTTVELGGAPPGIFEALQASATSRARPAARLLSTFASIDDVLDNINAGTPRRNKYDLLCPRPGCSSTILKASVGELVEVTSIQVRAAF